MRKYYKFHTLLVQIWRLATQVPDNVTNSYDVTIDSSAFTEADQQPVLPPLKARTRQSADVKITLRRKDVTVQSRRRNNSGPDRSFLQSSRSDERRTSLSPIPPGRKVAAEPWNRRSASVDYSLQQPEFKQALASGRKSPSPYRPAHRRNESAGKMSLTNEQQNTFILSRTTSPHAATDQVNRKNYPVVPSTSTQALGQIASNGGEPMNIPRPHSRKLHANFRSSSVYSPSSGGSVERPSERLVFSGKRRASLPTTALIGGNGFDANRSPEFYKTFNELRNGTLSNLEPRYGHFVNTLN